MRNEPITRIEQYRTRHPRLGGGKVGKSYGYFEVGILRVISSGNAIGNKSGWEHVSISRPNAIPTWTDMARVKNLFWRDDETVLQFHPKASEYVNDHPNCLHLWKKTGVDHELPPEICV